MTGALRLSYQWVNGIKRISGLCETCVFSTETGVKALQKASNLLKKGSKRLDLAQKAWIFDEILPFFMLICTPVYR